MADTASRGSATSADRLPVGGKRHLFYELHLTNFSDSPVALRSLDVLDGDQLAARPLATFSASDLARIARLIGSDDADAAPSRFRQAERWCCSSRS